MERRARVRGRPEAVLEAPAGIPGPAPAAAW